MARPLPADRLLVVRSEDFFADPAAVFGRILEFLGLPPWAPADFVNVSRQRRPAPPPIRRPLPRRAWPSAFAEPNDELVDVCSATTGSRDR